MLLAGLGQLALMQPDEGRNAEVAREMKESGAWLIPTYDGVTYLDKPAFFFKTVACSMTLLGETEMTARLPSAFFAFALVAITFLFCRREYNGRCAALAVMVLSTTPLYVAFARLVILDMMLAFFVCAAIFAGYIAEENEDRARRRWYLLGAAAAGLATLVKGPVGFLIPAGVLLSFHWIDGRREAWRRLFAPLNLAVFLAIVLPWFLGVVALRPEFAYYGIVQESLGRFSTTAFRRTEPFYFYLLIVGAGFFAWSILLPESIWTAWRARARWTRADRLCVTWAVTVVIFFSLSKSKLPGYILSVAVPFAMLVARTFSTALGNRLGPAARIIHRGTLLLAILSLSLAIVLMVMLQRPGGWWLAYLIPSIIALGAI